MRLFAILALSMISASVLAQSPDVAVRVDANINYIVSTGASNRARWFDATGRHSAVGLGITLEPGYYILLTERMQRIKDDLDRQNLDEAYIEDPGLWRVGRQYLPFGSGRIFRESAFALRGNIDVIKGAPVSIAACDNGALGTKGLLVRVGSNIGVSGATGRFLASSATSLTQIRPVEILDRKERGYKLALGADIRRRWGSIDVQAEALVLRQGETAFDPARNITCLTFAAVPVADILSASASWTREWASKQDFYQFESDLFLTRNLSLKSFVKFQRGTWQDLSVGLRIRF